MTPKSIFITTFAVVTHGVVGVALWQLWTSGGTLAWAGALLTGLPFALMLGAWMATKSVSRTSTGLPGLVFVTALGAALAVLPWLGLGGRTSALATGLALLDLGGVLLYVRWYSVFGRQRSAVLRPGERLPEFTLEDARGQPVTAADLRGKPTVLLFYRGNWCPLCIAQVREVAAMYRQLDERGARVALVSPQPHAQTRSLADRFDVPFDFLVDPGCRAATALGIVSPDGVPAGLQAMGYDTQTVMPTVIITDAQGRVLFADETDNYRVRPEPQTFLQVLDAHQA